MLLVLLENVCSKETYCNNSVQDIYTKKKYLIAVDIVSGYWEVVEE